MAHTRTQNYDFPRFGSMPAWTRSQEGPTWWRRLASGIAAKLRADQPTTAAGLAYNHAYRATPLSRK